MLVWAGAAAVGVATGTEVPLPVVGYLLIFEQYTVVVLLGFQNGSASFVYSDLWKEMSGWYRFVTGNCRCVVVLFCSSLRYMYEYRSVCLV